MNPVPTLDGEIIVLGDLRMTADEAHALARKLILSAEPARAAAHRRVAREQAAGRAAEYRARYPNIIEIGARLLIPLHDWPSRVDAFDAETGQRVSLTPRDIPTHPRIRYRTERSPVTHLWQGGANALCGAELGRPGGGSGSRDCARCLDLAKETP